MVVLNFTIIIELGLFLLFLWVTNKLILQPVLHNIDKREEGIALNEQAAETDAEEAEELEQRYAEAMAKARRAAHSEIEAARREAMDAHNAALLEHRRQADAEVEAQHESAFQKAEVERANYDALAPALADEIAGRLGVGGGQR